MPWLSIPGQTDGRLACENWFVAKCERNPVNRKAAAVYHRRALDSVKLFIIK